MNTMIMPKSFSQRPGNLALILVLPILALTAFPVAAAESAGGDESIVASLNPPPEGLNCADAAAQTSVYFNFARPEFQISRLSLFLDGRGVPSENIDEHWPTVTLTRGLHPGQNTVDIVADGAAGQTMNRRLVLQVGPGDDDRATANVSCDDRVAARGAPYEEDRGYRDDGGDDNGYQGESEGPEIVDGGPQEAFEDREPDEAYYGQPAYVYRPYPLVAFDAYVPIVPLFGFGFFYSHYHPYYHRPHLIYRPYAHYRGYRDHWGRWHNDRNRGGNNDGRDSDNDRADRGNNNDGRDRNNDRPRNEQRANNRRFDGNRNGTRNDAGQRQRFEARPNKVNSGVDRGRQQAHAQRPQSRPQTASPRDRGESRGGGNDKGGGRHDRR